MWELDFAESYRSRLTGTFWQQTFTLDDHTSARYMEQAREMPRLPESPPPRTHRALTCPDIILEIIEQTSPPSNSPSYDIYNHRKLLAILALVCKAFNGPATKILWSRLHSFVPLLAIFSAFDHKSTSTNLVPTYMISGDISPNEFSRFCELGHFVQAVIPQYECICESATIDSSTWHYLARVSPGKILFPSLQELHWTIRNPSNTDILFLVPPSLRSLTICYCGYSRNSREWMLGQEMLFRSIYGTAPQLTQLVICDIDGALLPACLANARALHKLRVKSDVKQVHVGFDTLCFISSMELLEELAFDSNSLEDWVDFSGFSALKKLEMFVLSGSTHPIFKAFSSPNLRELTLRTGDDERSDEASTTSAMLAQTFPSLEVLTWSFYIQDDMAVERALAPLFPLRLVKLSLKVIGLPVFTLSNDLFATMAKSWPGLVELCIEINAGPLQLNDAGLLSGITAPTLLELALGFPQLKTLRLPWMRSPQLEHVNSYPVLQHPLRILAINRLEVWGEAEHVACALVLDKLFPNLEMESPEWFPLAQSNWMRTMSGVRLCQLRRNNRTS